MVEAAQNPLLRAIRVPDAVTFGWPAQHLGLVTRFAQQRDTALPFLLEPPLGSIFISVQDGSGLLRTSDPIDPLYLNCTSGIPQVP